MIEMPSLETGRLLIRPFLPKDLKDVYRILDEELSKVDVGSEGIKNLSERREWLNWTIRSYRQLAELYQLPYGDRAVELKDAAGGRGSLIGVAGFVPSFGPFGQLPSFGGLLSKLLKISRKPAASCSLLP